MSSLLDTKTVINRATKEPYKRALQKSPITVKRALQKGPYRNKKSEDMAHMRVSPILKLSSTDPYKRALQKSPTKEPYHNQKSPTKRVLDTKTVINRSAIWGGYN